MFRFGECGWTSNFCEHLVAVPGRCCFRYHQLKAAILMALDATTASTAAATACACIFDAAEQPSILRAHGAQTAASAHDLPILWM